VVTPPAWILEHELIGNEAGKSAIIAQPTAHNAFGSGKKYTVSERTSERASSEPVYSADQIIEGIGRDRSALSLLRPQYKSENRAIILLQKGKNR